MERGVEGGREDARSPAQERRRIRPCEGGVHLPRVSWYVIGFGALVALRIIFHMNGLISEMLINHIFIPATTTRMDGGA